MGRKIGEAHQSYLDKSYDKATNICFQIIEQGHTECLEAINTWILCCEAQGKDEEMIMLLRAIKNDIASKKSKKGGDYFDWVKLAEQWESKGNSQWAYLCYVRALRKCKDNKELHRAKALCCLKMGKNYKYLHIMKNKVLTSPISEEFLQDVFQTANIYKESKKPEAACEILETAFNDMKSGKVAFQLFNSLEDIKDYEKIVKIYESHLQVLKVTELALELEIMYLIALLNTEGSISSKELDKKLQSVIKGIDQRHLNIGARLAEQLKGHNKNNEAEILYIRLSEFPSAPIFPQYILLLKDMRKYEEALKAIELWKEVGKSKDSAQIMKHHTEISSQLMLSKTDVEGNKKSASAHKSILPVKRPGTYYKKRTYAKVRKVEDGEEEKGMVVDVIADPNLIKILEKLISEWNIEKVKGKHNPAKIKELCNVIDSFLAQEAPSFVVVIYKE